MHALPIRVTPYWPCAKNTPATRTTTTALNNSSMQDFSFVFATPLQLQHNTRSRLTHGRPAREDSLWFQCLNNRWNPLLNRAQILTGCHPAGSEDGGFNCNVITLPSVTKLTNYVCVCAEINGQQGWSDFGLKNFHLLWFNRVVSVVVSSAVSTGSLCGQCGDDMVTCNNNVIHTSYLSSAVTLHHPL